MSYPVPSQSKIAVFFNNRGKVLGVAERVSSGTDSLSAWNPVADEPINQNPIQHLLQDFEPATFLRTSDSAVAPPPDDLVAAGTCFYVIQGGRAYKVCR